MHYSFSLQELPGLAVKLLDLLGEHRVVAIYGPMGAGKTTLVHALCDALGVQEAVSSPTFSIINEYAFENGTVYHLDCYRLRDEAEAVAAGVEDCLYSGQWCFVEWPEKIPHLIPENAAILKISVTAPSIRTLELEIKL
ncbi:tRNA (adenosine(37)-N6)-threonylcarbamoyltransferase complex ATPase subunit type 1 TsaE [Flavihumibacter profundi]|uniref:tRNA (adenosine(37)-N6)-threonylcarbamoyltransferase complex ATPase subunit type 1 TsaE n=1 Tax=Flavihumibacter profundi TaxID=2716883 RepID=UPI001CC69CC7|nr:tRNA (adenosine(37)-N6)-threonylcarbamoyltransferase complex ATPase subunit type 1 TsaE [Flavihumibacter profundi]MBZ5858151.1 tRNA (adenosine(37)-N6)-threonylcarbamoyltransferase complex ATPase subunit type 1 TsaE [Flavihumibacter profundi]